MATTDRIDQIQEKLDRMSEPRGECRQWTAAHNEHGYGLVRVDGRLQKAHRVAYTLAYGAIGDGLVVDHMCHNPACIRPEHLHAVTRRQNQENRRGAASGSRSGVRGVHWDGQTRMWRASVGHKGKLFHAGRFATIAEASAAAITLRNRLHTNNLADQPATGK